jgi:hypothetical protein
MYLYKPACADIPSPKLGVPKSSDLALKCRWHLAVTKTQPQGAYWPVRSSAAVEWKCLEKFLHMHGISLQETTKAWTGMAYRYCWLECHPTRHCTEGKVVAIKIIMIEGVNSNMIYLIHCKNLCKCKCHKVSPPSTTIKEKIKYKRQTLYCSTSTRYLEKSKSWTQKE